MDKIPSMANSKLADGSGPINQDSRDQILRDIQYGRDLQVKVNQRVASIPPGRPTPFNSNQAAYEAALQGFSDTDRDVLALEARLKNVQGPYWNDMTAAEKDDLALWTESLKQMDAITAAHYPTPFEMDIKKAILLVIGIGSFLIPLFVGPETDSDGFPIRVIPNPPALPFDRVPEELPKPVRPAMSPVVSRLPMSPSAIPATPVIVQERLQERPSLPIRPGYEMPPRFTRGFSSDSESPERVRVPSNAGNIPIRPPGEHRFVYPKPRTT